MNLVRIIAVVVGALLANEVLRRNGIDLAGRLSRRMRRRSAPRPVDIHTAVDHDRPPGVPPEHNLDYKELLDIEGAGTFPASDPPSGW